MLTAVTSHPLLSHDLMTVLAPMVSGPTCCLRRRPPPAPHDQMSSANISSHNSGPHLLSLLLAHAFMTVFRLTVLVAQLHNLLPSPLIIGVLGGDGRRREDRLHGSGGFLLALLGPAPHCPRVRYVPTSAHLIGNGRLAGRGCCAKGPAGHG